MLGGIRVTNASWCTRKTALHAWETQQNWFPYLLSHSINKNTLSYLALEAEEAAEVDLTDEEIDECGGDIFFGFWIWFLCGNCPLGELLGEVDGKLPAYFWRLVPFLELWAIRFASGGFLAPWAFLKLPAG